MSNITITHFFALIGILCVLSYISDLINKKDHFVNQKSKKCSKEEINNAYRQYIFETPKFIR